MENKDLAAIRKKLGHMTMAWKPTEWLDTGIPDLNNVLGHPEKGIPYGRMLEISGWESSGKTALTMAIAALAQQNGAQVIWGDVENSFEAEWAIQRGFAKCPHCNGTRLYNGSDCGHCEYEGASTGIDFNSLILIRPYVGNFGSESESRLTTAQELCCEIEEAIKMKRKRTKSIVVLDSIAALLTAGEADVDLSGTDRKGKNVGGMRTSMALPLFMSRLLKRWVGLAQVHNALIVLINQLREGPTAFGDPSYTPGGNAARFYSHIRVRVHRVAGSKIIDKGKVIGIKGAIVCKKNKTGGTEAAEIGYRLMYKGAIEFVPVSEVKKKEAE